MQENQTAQIIDALKIEVRKSLLIANKKWLTMEEFAQVSGYAHETIRKMCKEGRLCYSKPEGTKIIYINQKEFIKFLDKNKVDSIFDIASSYARV